MNFLPLLFKFKPYLSSQLNLSTKLLLIQLSATKTTKENMSFDKFLLAVVSRDLPQAEKELTACKAE